MTGKSWAALWIVYVLWGSTYLGIAITVETLPPLLAVATRFFVAGAILALVVRARGGTLRVSPASLGAAVLVGCLLPGANAILFFAERNVPSGLAALIIAAVPLWVVVLRLLAGHRLRPLALAGVAVGFAGVVLLLHPEGGATMLGIGLCVLASAMWALGSFLSGRLPLPVDPFAATAYEMLGAGSIMLVPGLLTAHSFAPSGPSIAAWIYLVLFGSVVGYTAYVWLLAHAPLGTVSTYAYVNPVVAIALGVLLHGEDLTGRILIGAAIVVVAVAVVVRADAPPRAQTPA